MDNSLLISRYCQSILEENADVVALLDNDTTKIFTLNKLDSLQFPFICHYRNNINANYTKDGHWYNIVQYTVKCVCNDYDKVLDLANAARHALEMYRWKDKDIYIHPIQFVSVQEYLVDDAIVEELQFQMMVE